MCQQAKLQSWVELFPRKSTCTSPGGHLIIWPPDDQLMITWSSTDDQLMIIWWSSDDQLIIILSLIQTPSGLFAINICRTWKVAWGEVEGEGSQIRGDHGHTSPKATYHLRWSVVYCHWLCKDQKSKHITFIHGFDCDHNRHHNPIMATPSRVPGPLGFGEPE